LDQFIFYGLRGRREGFGGLIAIFPHRNMGFDGGRRGTIIGCQLG